MKYLIFGHPKSGTTALFYKIKKALPSTTHLGFEPPAWIPPADLAERDVLVKALTSTIQSLESFDRFDRKIFILRDTRDRLISWLLYTAYNPVFRRNQAAVKKFVALLEEKQANPGSISVVELFQRKLSYQENVRDQLVDYLRNDQVWAGFAGQHPDYFVFKYEDLVQERFDGVEKFLGIRLGAAEVDSTHARVVRSKSFGAWRDWFTPDDVAFFRPILGPSLEIGGYDASDWALAERPVIAAEHGSEYVRRIAERKLGSMSPRARFRYQLGVAVRRVLRSV